MHPLLARRGRFGPYLAAWTPLAAITAALLALAGGLGWIEAVAMAVPLCLFYAFVSLSPWYLVRFFPATPAAMPRLVVTHLAGSIVASLAWVLAGLQLAYVLVLVPHFAGLPERFSKQTPILLALGIVFYLLSVAFHYALAAAETTRESERREMESRLAARDAELRALRDQLNPHFLFNGLNSVSALTSSDPEKAREMCLLLSGFLRSSLGAGEKGTIPLGEELELARVFLSIEQVRFGERLRVEERIDDAVKGVQVPPLLLQPLVENAVTHGIDRLVGGGTIRIEARRRGDLLEVTVENPVSPVANLRPGAGLGLANVRRRLAAHYAEEAVLEARPADGKFRVELRLPAGGF